MTSPTIIILLVIAAAVVAVMVSKRKSDIDIPPAPQRSDLLFGYYGTKGPQVVETLGHINLLFECLWDGLPSAITNMQTAQLPTVLDVADYLFPAPVRIVPGKSAVHPRPLLPDAEQRLRGLCDALRAAGVLHLVRYIVPTDEPQLPENNTIAAIPGACALIRRVAADYPELDGVGLWCIYYAGAPMDHVELFDVVGFDDYDAKSSIFAPGAMYDQMAAKLRPGQRTALLLGATYGQDPTPFLNFANAHPEVLALIAFLWREPGHGNRFTGIHSMPEMRAKYEALGRLVAGRGE